MCTLTWQRQEDGLEVFFNRDELKTRSRAKPPCEYSTEKRTRYLSPIDTDAGGTWMLVNEHGLLACLLNRWHDEGGLTFRKSRGRIVTDLADARHLEDLHRLLPNRCDGAKPFDLLAFKGEQVAGFTWDGKELSTLDPRMPMTSSSFEFEDVKTSREKAFAESSSLEEFQSSEGCCNTAYTVRMNRPDAQTWSRSRVRVGVQEITWDYWEEFPDLAKESELHHSTLLLKR